MRRLAIVLLLALSLPAIADQKNVKLLTGLSDYELVRVMNQMRGSLGVNCDFCHVVKGEDWDFASDEKKEKQRAREMIVMTRGLNENSFGGRTIIGCNTCHRGAQHPVGTVALPQPIPPFPTPEGPKRTGLPTAEEIIKKYASAAGDASKWATFTAKGVRETSDGKSQIPFEMHRSGDTIHMIATTPNGKIEQTFKGKEGSVKTEKGTTEMSASDLERYRDQSAAYEITRPDALPKDGVVTGKEKINDHEAYAFFTRVTPKVRQRLYFDTTTGLLLRRVIISDGPVGPIPQQTDFDDWRDVNGTKFPFSIRISLVDPWSSATRKFSEVAWK
jgi:hypothetical protein